MDPDLSTVSTSCSRPQTPMAIHTSRARSHVNSWCLISSQSDRHSGQVLEFPIYLLAKIPRLGTSPWRTRHPKIFNFSGSFKSHSFFHTWLFPTLPGPSLALPLSLYLASHWTWYADLTLTENRPLWLWCQAIKSSLPGRSGICRIRWASISKNKDLIRSVSQVPFIGLISSLTVVNRVRPRGVCICRLWDHGIHLSSQIFIWLPSPTLQMHPRLKQSILLKCSAK